MPFIFEGSFKATRIVYDFLLVKNDFYKIPEEWTKDGNCDVLEDCLAEIEGVAARIFKKITLSR